MTALTALTRCALTTLTTLTAAHRALFRNDFDLRDFKEAVLVGVAAIKHASCLRFRKFIPRELAVTVGILRHHALHEDCWIAATALTLTLTRSLTRSLTLSWLTLTTCGWKGAFLCRGDRDDRQGEAADENASESA